MKIKNFYLFFYFYFINLSRFCREPPPVSSSNLLIQKTNDDYDAFSRWRHQLAYWIPLPSLLSERMELLPKYPTTHHLCPYVYSFCTINQICIIQILKCQHISFQEWPNICIIPSALFGLIHWLTIGYFNLALFSLHWLTIGYMDLALISLHWFTIGYFDLALFSLHWLTIGYFNLALFSLHWLTIGYMDLALISLHWLTIGYFDLALFGLHWLTIGYIYLF